MPLTNKYLKYSPEITLEIFTLVYNKLDSIYNNAGGVKTYYSNFKGNWPAIYLRDNVFMTAGRSYCNNLLETTVQEILGYDPYVKEFVLPKSWCLRTTPETDKILCEWRGGGHCGDTKDSLLVYDPESTCPRYWENIKKIDKYQEITFDQFKKYVLKEPVEKEVIPKYVECIKSATLGVKVGEILECKEEKNVFEWKYNNKSGSYSGWDCWGGFKWTSNRVQEHFKPSTKEAFEAQNKPKSIEEWSVGSYIVFLQDKVLTRSGKVTKGKVYTLTSGGDCPYFNDDNHNQVNFRSGAFESYGLQWFATKIEAEEFAKTLIQPVKEEVKQPDTIECEECNGTGEVMVGKLYPNGHTEVNEECPICGGEGFIDKPKQSLKQAVHCKTQEEWDFVLSKFNPKDLTSDRFNRYKSNSIIIFSKEKDKIYFGSYSNKNETSFRGILSFQEWCDLNGYKMENKCEFEVGKWYSFNWDWKGAGHTIIAKIKEVCDESITISWRSYLWNKKDYGSYDTYYLKEISDIKELSIEEIQQYLPDGHVDKIQLNPEFKVGDYVMVRESELPITYNWLGEGGRIYKQGVFKIEKMEDGCIQLLGDIKCCLNPNRFRHATPEEINNHLISIGQIPAEPICTNTNSHRHDGCGERYGCIQNCNECDYNQIPAGAPINGGIEPDENGMFKYTTVPGASFGDNYSSAIIYSNSSSKHQEILTKNEIKLNYLPEPK